VNVFVTIAHGRLLGDCEPNELVRVFGRVRGRDEELDQ
jgi:hypothetical protein